MLDDRKLAVLRAIVEDFVSTNEPVGSKSLVDRHNLDVSPADDPQRHGRAGGAGLHCPAAHQRLRIPTDQGYRLFVDRLSGVKPLSGAERRAIETFLAGAYDLDDVVMRTVRLLAQLTRQVAVVQYPSLTRSTVRHIELVPLTNRRPAARADYRHRPGRAAYGRVAGPIGEDSITQLRAVLNACLDGRRLADVASVVAELPERVSARRAAQRDGRVFGDRGDAGGAARRARRRRGCRKSHPG